MSSFGVQKLFFLSYPYTEKEDCEEYRKHRVYGIEETEEEQTPYRG